MSSKRSADRPGLDRAELAILAVTLVLLGVAALCTGCHTMEVVQELPEGYWSTTWSLVEAVALDVWSLVKLLVPV